VTERERERKRVCVSVGYATSLPVLCSVHWCGWMDLFVNVCVCVCVRERERERRNERESVCVYRGVAFTCVAVCCSVLQ